MVFALPTTSPDPATSSPIAARFSALAAAGRRALVCYVTAGHPDPTRSLALIRGLEAAGADIIEVGVPFSDPLADGPIIQRSSQRALDQGMTLAGTLSLIAEARSSVPIVLFSYLNPLMAAGPDVLHVAADKPVVVPHSTLPMPRSL